MKLSEFRRLYLLAGKGWWKAPANLRTIAIIRYVYEGDD